MNLDSLRRWPIVAQRRAARPHRVRTRDPERKSRILTAAAELVARNGFHAVSMADIGAAAGITGSGVYRHFERKSAVLVALFDQCIDDLLHEEQQIIASVTDVREALDQLVAGQVEFVVADRELARVYYSEINNLPDQDRRRLRRKQRIYLEEWVHLVSELQAGLSDADARTLVHAMIGAIQSPLFHNAGLDDDRQRGLLIGAARAIAGISG
jgi:AcrR family transcriptional regulator